MQRGRKRQGQGHNKHPRTLGQIEFHKGEERGNKVEELFEGIMAENLPKIMKIQDAWRTPRRVNNKKNTPRYIIVKDKEKTVKVARGGKKRHRGSDRHYSRLVRNFEL